VLFSEGRAGDGGTVGWSPREQFEVLWDGRRIGEAGGCAFYLMHAGNDPVDLVLDVAFGADDTEVRLGEQQSWRKCANTAACGPRAATDELMSRLRTRGQD
jgi:hypothetical protein